MRRYKSLLSAGANTNARDAAGVTPLMLAAAAGGLYNIDLLRAAGARLDMKDYQGSSDHVLPGLPGPGKSAAPVRGRDVDLRSPVHAAPIRVDGGVIPAGQPLAVIFEQPNCHACDVLHSEPLQDAVVRERLAGFDVAQLSVWDDETPVPTPDGRRSTPRRWAKDLELFYTPTLVFFDAQGQGIFRIDSVVQFFRLAGVLRYVAEQAYQENPVFQHWKFAQNKSEQEAFSGKPNKAIP